MLELHEITRPDDRKLVTFLRLLQTLFPVEEQVMAADVLEVVQSKARGGAGRHHLLTASEPAGDPLAMAWYEEYFPEVRQSGPMVPLVVLWYMGVDTPVQSRGFGSYLYREICRRAFENGCPALVMEVERVDVAARHGEERAAAARRRLEFYIRRHGARVLEGVDYEQDTGWQPSVPMHLVVQPGAGDGLPPDRLFPLLRQVFGGSLSRRPDQPLAFTDRF
jgi:GNAT superfamily N-acetyltransferase